MLFSYKAKSKDEFLRRYDLGSVHPRDEYNETNLTIGGLLPALQVRSIHKKEQQDYFYIWTGFPLGFTSEEKVQKYLSAVSKYL